MNGSNEKIKNSDFCQFHCCHLISICQKNQITKANHRWSTNATRTHQTLRAMVGYRENPLLNINRIRIKIKIQRFCGFAICPPINNILFGQSIDDHYVCVALLLLLESAADLAILHKHKFKQNVFKIKRNRMEMNKFFENCIIKCSGISIC